LENLRARNLLEDEEVDVDGRIASKNYAKDSGC
jgi:hypothetical protein